MSATVSGTDNSMSPVCPREDRNTRPEVATRTNAQLIGWLMMVSYHSKSASAESFESLEELAHAIPSETDDFPELHQVIDAIRAFAQTKIYDPLLAGKASAALSLLKSDVKVL